MGKVLDPAFARRLEQSCENNPEVPPKHTGRQEWVKNELRRRMGLTVTSESVRKWFTGESRPRPDKMIKLAELLQVDMVWLSLGVQPQFSEKEQKIRNALANGAVNVVAGFIQMDGGTPAFPTNDNEKRRSNIDLYAIIRGVNYAFHVAPGDIDMTGKTLSFSLPASDRDYLVLGVIRPSKLCIQVAEIKDELIERYGQRRGGITEVVIPRAQFNECTVEDFSRRL